MNIPHQHQPVIVVPPPTLRGALVILKPTEISDAGFLHSMFADPVFAFSVGLEPAGGLAQFTHLLALNLPQSSMGLIAYKWTVFSLDTNKPVGWVELSLNGDWGVSYGIHPAQHRHGYAAEALPLVLQFAFHVKKLHRITAEVSPSNLASLGLLERFGFEAEGIMRDRQFWSGEYRNMKLLSLLRPDYERRFVLAQ